MRKGKDNMSELLNTEHEGFTIDTDAKAEWALGKIRAARADRDRMIEWYKAKINEITEQTESETAYLEGMLSGYFRMTEQAHKRTKTQETYSLPSGKLILKKQNPEYKRDEKTVIEWLKENKLPQFVKVTESLDWAALKAATGTIGGNVVTEDGEIIPGIEVTEREEKFIVEV